MTHYNFALLILSYAVAVVGSFMALVITRDARLRLADNRRNLIFLASLCLGGIAIWSMHFIGMLAFDMRGMAINYNWGLTALSFFVGIGVVYIGLAIMALSEFDFLKLILAGILVGLGVSAMHYTGMLSMQMQANMYWNNTLIVLSVAIAVSVSIVALWLAVHVKHLWQMAVSALVMGAAVCGMHYTGMAAVDFVHNPSLPPVEAMHMTPYIFALLIAIIDSVIVIFAMAQAMAEANNRKRVSI